MRFFAISVLAIVMFVYLDKEFDSQFCHVKFKDLTLVFPYFSLSNLSYPLKLDALQHYVLRRI